MFIGFATLVSAVVGALGGSMPKIFELFEKKMSFKQEMAIREFEFKNRMQEHAMQLELAKAGISGKIDEALVDAFRAEVEGNSAALLEVIRAQQQPTGFAVLDFVNAAIRPIYFLGTVVLFLVLCAAYAWSDPGRYSEAMVSLFVLGMEGAIGVHVGQRFAAKVAVDKKVL